MDQDIFKAGLAASGYADVETRDLDPRPANTEHAHDYDIRGLVLKGIFVIRQKERVARYRAGEIFDVPAGVNHAEEIGSDGARVIIGRRSNAPR